MFSYPLREDPYAKLSPEEALKNLMIEALLGKGSSAFTISGKLKRIEDVLQRVEESEKVNLLGNAVLEAIKFGKTLDNTRDFVRKVI